MFHLRKRAVWLIAAAATTLSVSASTPDSFTVSGGSASERYQLSVYDRINFKPDHMELVSTTDETVEPIRWNYTEGNIISFGDYSGIESVETPESKKSALRFADGLLHIDSHNPADFSVALFGIDGKALGSGRFGAEGSYKLPDLAAGIYVALATDGKEKLSLIFNIR